MTVLRKPAISKADLKIVNKRRIDHYNKKIRIRLNILWFSVYCDRANDIALAAGSSVRQVFSIFRIYEEGGIDAVMHVEHHNPTSELEGFADLIQSEFLEHPPSSIKEARIKIQKMTGIKRSDTQIRKFLKGLGMRLLKPTLLPMGSGEKDLAEKSRKQHEFMDKKLEPLLKEAESGKRKVLFMDACHVQLACILGFLWCFARKYIRALPLRGRVNVIGACSAYGDDIICDVTQETVNGDAIGYFLFKVRNKIPDGKITLVLDNAQYQKTAYIQQTADDLGIELLYLPVASPNLNIIERLWKFLKKTFVANKIFESLNELEKHLKKSISTLKNRYKKSLKSILTLNFQYFDEAVQFQAA